MQGPLGQDLHIWASKSALWNFHKIVKEGPSRELIRFLCQHLWEPAKMSTAPHWEPCKVRDLRERYQKKHRAATRAIRCAQSYESVARTHVKISSNTARTTKREHWKREKPCLPMFQFRTLFRRGFCSIAPATEKRASCIRSTAPTRQNDHHVPSPKWRQLRKKRLSRRWKLRPSSPNIALAAKNDIRNKYFNYITNIRHSLYLLHMMNIIYIWNHSVGDIDPKLITVLVPNRWFFSPKTWIMRTLRLWGPWTPLFFEISSSLWVSTS